MSCSNLTAGITTGCNNSIGGIQTIRIYNGYTSYVENSLGQITSITPNTYYEFDVDTGAASFTETYEVNKNASILGFRQSVTIQLNGMEASTQQTIEEIAEANGMLVLVKDNNDSWWTIGLTRGAYLETGSTTTGVAYTDVKASTLTITGVEPTSTRQFLILENIGFKDTWTETSTCGSSAGTPNGFSNGTTAQAKCEMNDANAYMQLDPLGCYPTYTGVSEQGFTLKIPENETIGVGTQLYAFGAGNPATTTATFWYRLPIGPSTYDAGGYYQYIPDHWWIGRMVNGVVTEFAKESTYTCIP